MSDDGFDRVGGFPPSARVVFFWKGGAVECPAWELMSSARYGRAGPFSPTSEYGAFQRWCQNSGETALPCSRETIVAYVSHLCRTPALARRTILTSIQAINAAHLDADLPLPAAGAARKQLNLIVVRQGKAGITDLDLNVFLLRCSRPGRARGWKSGQTSRIIRPE